MKARKTCLYYLLVLVTAIMLSGCSRYNPPVESFQSSETQPLSRLNLILLPIVFSGKLSVLILSISTLWSDTLKTTELKHRR